MLHIGEGKVVSPEKIVIILPLVDGQSAKSQILLADGQVLISPIAAATLQKRLKHDLIL